MASVLADTHSFLWYLLDPGKLSAAADSAMQTADSTQGEFIHVSAISLCESLYLVEKGKVLLPDWQKAWTIIHDPATAYQVLLVDSDVADVMNQIPRNIVPDLPDRIICATAWKYQLPLVTRDRQIRKAPVTTIW